MKVGLVACCSSKLTRAAPAWQLYTSPLFRLSVAYLTQKVGVDRWYVLSAKHGLVAPETVLEPYDETLTKASKVERAAWGEKVAEQVYAEWRKAGVDWEKTVLAGASYVRPLRTGLRNVLKSPHVRLDFFHNPLDGKSIGERLHWLGDEIGRGDKATRKAKDLEMLIRRVKWFPRWGNAEAAVVDGVPVSITWDGKRWRVEIRSLVHQPMLAYAATKDEARAGAIHAARERSWLVTGFAAKQPNWFQPSVTVGSTLAVAERDPEEEFEEIVAGLTASTRRLGEEKVKEMGLEKLAETLGITWGDE